MHRVVVPVILCLFHYVIAVATGLQNHIWLVELHYPVHYLKDGKIEHDCLLKPVRIVMWEIGKQNIGDYVY